MGMIRARIAQAFRRDQDSNMDVYLVTQRQPLSEKPVVWRWLARLVYFAIGWSSDYGVEYQGVYTDEAEARHAASADGWSYYRLPLNGCLPCETVKYGVHDFPLSDASAAYRRMALPFVAVPMKDLQNLVLLENKLDDLHDRLDARHLKPQ